jgi:hypothetical protein
MANFVKINLHYSEGNQVIIDKEKISSVEKEIRQRKDDKGENYEIVWYVVIMDNGTKYEATNDWLWNL